MGAARFIVGIDLGTTHTVVACAPTSGDGDAEVFAIPQLETAAEEAKHLLLPSVLYAPIGETTAGATWLDRWGEPPWIKGEYARRRAAEVPGRLVASAKSWLCHSGVDRLAPILPWGAHDDVPKISPCDASALLLAHVRRAWDEAHPDAPLADQEVVLTVPASFDEVARELTVLAATRAGLTVRLLEEPQAAFYDYRSRASDDALAQIAADSPVERGALVLVCDVGGGTTDLSLLRVARAERGEASVVTRVAVGRHLLLGGDNMDLALAHACEPRLTEDKLDAPRFGELVLACRAAKELLFRESAPEEAPVTLAPVGSSLVGRTLATRLTRREAESIVLDGFFPVVPRDAAPDRTRSGFSAFGLPYERDVAITRHVAAFLSRHTMAGEAPKAVLLNGGVFHAPRVARRLVDALVAWGGPGLLRLAETDPDLAVARGAVAYARAREGRGALIESGAARGYYVEVGRAETEGRTVMCVVPRGTPEGTRSVATGAPIALVVGRPARFEIFACDNARAHAPGELVPLGEDFDPLAPAYASFAARSRQESSIRVGLEGEVTGVGTLDLACVELGPSPGQSPRRFRLAFALDASAAIGARTSAPPSSASPPRALDAALVAIDRALGKTELATSSREVKDLGRELERLLGERSKWTTGTSRCLFDALAAFPRGRRRSVDHERVFWQLAGYCLRPGVGDRLDPARVSRLVGLLPEKLAFSDQVRAWQAFWIAWRRVSAGLDDAVQARLRDLVDPFLSRADGSAGRLKKPKGVSAEAPGAMLDLASSLERLPQARRAELGAWLLERTWTDRDPGLWSALGRIGARVPMYATVDHVLPPRGVERWVEHLLREKWDGVTTAPEAAMRMARFTDDRGRDLSESVRAEVAARLLKVGVPEAEVRVVTEWVPVAERDRAAFYGETMPAGLQLIG